MLDIGASEKDAVTSSSILQHIVLKKAKQTNNTHIITLKIIKIFCDYREERWQPQAGL